MMARRVATSLPVLAASMVATRRELCVSTWWTSTPSIDVSESCLAPLTFASHGYEDFHLLMPLYICRRWKGQAIGAEGQEIAWVRPLKLKDYPMPPADVPLIPHLIDLL